MISLNVKELHVTWVVRKVLGQLHFYHFNHPVYQNVRCEIPIQNKVAFDNFSIFLKTKKIAVLKTSGRCAQPRVKMLQICEGNGQMSEGLKKITVT